MLISVFSPLKLLRGGGLGLIYWAIAASSSWAQIPASTLEQLPSAPEAINNWPTATPALPAATEQAYRLGVGDRLQIEVFNVPEYSGEYQVLVDGALNLPMVGRVSVKGLSLAAAGEAIGVAYAPLVRRPLVTVSLLQPRPVEIAIAGEVSRPGVYTLAVEEGAKFPSLVQAIQTAGGLTQVADLAQIQLRRPQANGTAQVTQVNLWALLQQGDLSQNPALQDGDTLVIPTVAQTDLAAINQLAAANFAEVPDQSLNIAVVGEVFRPGSHQLNIEEDNQDQPTLTRALQVAGGITPTANIRQLEVRRQTRSGSTQTIPIDLWALLQGGDLQQDLILQQGDTIVVPEAANLSPEEAVQLASASFSPNEIEVNVVGRVEEPGVVKLRPNTPLNQALLAAGGFSNEARTESVELIRLNPDGTATRRNIEVDLSAGIDEDTNPILRHQDVVVVAPSGLTNLSENLGALFNPLRLLLPFSIFF
ncbi:MAG: SLBB domain-containing protein [Almyronema sp.]